MIQGVYYNPSKEGKLKVLEVTQPATKIEGIIEQIKTNAHNEIRNPWSTESQGPKGNQRKTAKVEGNTTRPGCDKGLRRTRAGREGSESRNRNGRCGDECRTGIGIEIE